MSSSSPKVLKSLSDRAHSILSSPGERAPKGITGWIHSFLSSRNFLLLSLISIGGTVVGMGLGYLFRIITARALPLEEVGQLGVWLGWAAILSSPMGVVMAVISRELAKREDKPQQMHFLVKKYLWKIGLIATVGALLLAGGTYVLGQPLLALVLISLPFSYLLAIFNSYLQATERILQYTLINNGLLLVKVLAVLLFLAWGWGLAGSIGAVLASGLVACLVAGAYVWPKLRGEQPVELQLRWAIGLLLIIQVLMTVIGFLDLFAVQHFRSDAAAGIYVVAQTTAQILTYLAGAVATVLFPKISKLDKANMGGRGMQLLGASMAILLPVFAGLLLLAKPFILTFYGEKFAASVPPFQILLIGALFMGAAQIMVSFLYARHREKWVLATYAGAIAVDGALLYALVPAQGLVGAAMSVSITAALLAAVLGAACGLEISKAGGEAKPLASAKKKKC